MLADPFDTSPSQRASSVAASGCTNRSDPGCSRTCTANAWTTSSAIRGYTWRFSEPSPFNDLTATYLPSVCPSFSVTATVSGDQMTGITQGIECPGTGRIELHKIVS